MGDIGPIQIIDDLASISLGLTDTDRNAPSFPGDQNSLPACVKSLAGPGHLFRACPNGQSTNLLLILHGAGERKTSALSSLGLMMDLPQTATLVLRGWTPIIVPVGESGWEEGYTWFHDDMDFTTGDSLSPEDPRRTRGLRVAVRRLNDLVEALSFRTPRNSLGWPRERIFAIGFGCGASLLMETAASVGEGLGGIVCVAGGMRPVRSPIVRCGRDGIPVLIVVGRDDKSFSPSDAEAAVREYNNCFQESGDRESVLQVPQVGPLAIARVIKEKRTMSIGSREEMRVVMEFLASKLVIASNFPDI